MTIVPRPIATCPENGPVCVFYDGTGTEHRGWRLLTGGTLRTNDTPQGRTHWLTVEEAMSCLPIPAWEPPPPWKRVSEHPMPLDENGRLTEDVRVSFPDGYSGVWRKGGPYFPARPEGALWHGLPPAPVRPGSGA